MNPKNSFSHKPTKITKGHSSSWFSPLPLVKNIVLGSLSAVALCVGGTLQAQTTLSGDHVITGDLNVGTSGTTGNVLVTGDTGGSAAPGLKVTGDGGVVFTGSFGVGQIPTEAAGTRFMWYPKKAALRVGSFVGESASQYDWSMGEHSFGFGVNVMAAGNSFAFGKTSEAADFSFVFGENTFANDESFSMGGWAWASTKSFAFGWNAVAVGESIAMATDAGSEYDSVAIGVYSTALEDSVSLGSWASSAYSSVALGSGAWAAQQGVAIGYGSQAIDNSFAAGVYGVADGEYAIAICGQALAEKSIAFGSEATAYSRNEVVIGRFNREEGNSQSWIGSEPLFVIGNGTGNGGDPIEVQYRNAFTVYKNGKVKMERQGDILMGEFGNPEE